MNENEEVGVVRFLSKKVGSTSVLFSSLLQIVATRVFFRI